MSLRILILINCCTFTLAALKPRAIVLQNNLIDKGCWPLDNYPHLHPTLSKAELPVNVSVEGFFETVAAISDKQQIMSLTGSIAFRWHISCAVFEHFDEFKDVDFIHVQSKYLWKPSITHKNTVDNYFINTGLRETSRIRIRATGEVMYWVAGIFTSSCHFNFRKFPFDKQQCQMVLESFEGPKSVVLSTYSRQRGPSNIQIGDYRFIKSAFKASLKKYGNDSAVEFTCHFERESEYYIVTLILPVMFLMVLQLTAFFIPNSPERCTFLLTILLAINLIQQVVDANIPHLTTTPLIAYSLLGFTASATFQCCYAVLILAGFNSRHVKSVKIFKRKIDLPIFIDIFMCCLSTLVNSSISLFIFYEIVIDNDNV